MEINRIWAMPNKWTFQIPPIAELLKEYVGDGTGWIDPFAGQSTMAQFRNDLDPSSPAPNHLTAEEWVNSLGGEYRGILFDPPYSGRQVKECYSHLNKKVHRDDTNAYFYGNIKRLISPKIMKGGYAISCGWNTNGFGRGNGFEILEILLVCHGSSHNDTIVVVEHKSVKEAKKKYEHKYRI
jgi:hypothetical protein